MILNYIKTLIKKGDKNYGTEDSKKGGEDKAAKRASVIKWLEGDQVDLAPLSYELAGETDGVTNPDETEKGAIRSEFYKKVQGRDDDGKPYHFTDDEINTLYNMKDEYIDSIQ